MIRSIFIATLLFSLSAFSYLEINLQPKDFRRVRRWHAKVEGVIRNQHRAMNIRFCACVILSDLTAVRYGFYNSQAEAEQALFLIADSFGKVETEFYTFKDIYRQESFDSMTGIILE